MKIIIIILILSLISCKKKVNYDKIYLVKLNNHNIGFCTQFKNVKECNIFFYSNSKEISYKTTLIKNDEEYEYKTLNFKSKFKTNKQVYPFLFDKFKLDDKVYFPKKNIEITVKELGIEKLEDGYKALPFIYKKTDKIPSIDKIDIENLKNIFVKEIKDNYLMELKIELTGNYIPPNDLRQNCNKKNKKIICTIKRVEIIKINQERISKKSKNKNLLNFIKKYDLDKKHILKSLKKLGNPELISQLTKALHKEIKYEDISLDNNSETILKNKKGDCTEFSHLAKDVLNEIGINAKKVYGLIYQNKKFVYHSWVEYQIKDKIFAFDPTLKKSMISPFYVKLTEENKYGIMIMPIIEDIKILSTK